MPTRPKTSIIDSVATKLRQKVLALPEGAAIGSEDALIAELGAARTTVRQVARLLEREGLLRVKRGNNGGYYGTRPNAGTIETTVSAYLETLDMDDEDVTTLASVLWVEAVRRAATLKSEAARKITEKQRKKVLAVKSDTTFHDIAKLEDASHDEIFKLVNSRYIELIFHINGTFARRRFGPHRTVDGSPEHRAFISSWRNAKLLELSAIADGNVELAILAAQQLRQLWHQRVWD